jgi:methylated-DNA-[protein]-cysteine S-methyltransferase
MIASSTRFFYLRRTSIGYTSPLNINCCEEFTRMKNQKIITSPIGKLLIEVEDGFLVKISQPKNAAKTSTLASKLMPENRRVLSDAEQQLKEFFSGQRRKFTLPLKRQATTFQEKVWREISRVPFGTTTSYKELAERAGSPGAARAVGNACNRNPLLIVVPCHRVRASNGSLRGFAAGIVAKKSLIAHESIVSATVSK